MKEIKDFNMYDNSSLSFMFEFKSPIRRRDLASKFSKNLGKKVKLFSGVNESYSPTSEVLKMSNKYSKDSKFFILETGFIKYHDAIHLMLKSMNLIEHFGTTDDYCNMQVNIRIDDSKKGYHVSNLNRFKYLIGLNETEILTKWESKSSDRKKLSISQHSYLKAKDPYSTILTMKSVERLDPHLFEFPKSEFFGHDFSHLGEGYVALNYIGGRGYQKKKDESIETINEVLERLHKTLAHNYEYDESERRKIEELVLKYNESVNSTRNFLKFRSKYPDIKISVDLNPNEYVIDSSFNEMRNFLFDITVFGGVTEAHVNYDRERGKMQIKGATLSKSILSSGVEFYDCKVEIEAKNCVFERCEISHSKLEHCDILSSNYIRYCKRLECKYHGTGNEISKSYIKGSQDGAIGADIRECIVADANFRLGSSADDQSVII